MNTEQQFSRRSLRARLLLYGIALTALPLLVIGVTFQIQKTRMSKVVAKESSQLAHADLDHVLENIYSMCEIMQHSIDLAASSAAEMLNLAGSVSLGTSSVDWQAANPKTTTRVDLQLPKLRVGGEWIGKNEKQSIPSPIVDKISKAVGGTCTIYQRMNAEGDMIRVSTTSLNQDGSRAIGTYISHKQDDGKAHPVIAAVLRGESYRGRARVLNQWYITAYEPIRDDKNELIGILGIGIPENECKELRQAIMNVQLGKTGYMYVLDSQGNYVVSKGGTRDGENIMEAKDSKGYLFIRDICQTAPRLKPSEIGEKKYLWLDDQGVEREKIARLKYFEPWDWIIGSSYYVDELHAAKNNIDHINHEGMVILLVILVVSLMLATLIWVIVSGRIGKSLGQVINQLSAGSVQVAAASSQVAAASQSLAEGATQQAASLEESSSSLEEMSSMIQMSSEHAKEADVLTSKATQAATAGFVSMEKMNSAIQAIQESSSETAKIIKVIDEIAFQTNLLALNAAVEAARAGEAGQGFAVVAEEVRNLAMRSAEAAKTTTDLISDSVRNSDGGVAIAAEVGSALEEIADQVGKASGLVGEIATAAEEQAQGISEINDAVTQMDSVTQANAANAEESASASEELNQQSNQMKTVVDDLEQLVAGSAGIGASALEGHQKVKRKIVFREATVH